MLKSNVSDIYSDKYTKIKTNTNDYLPSEETKNMHHLGIL